MSLIVRLSFAGGGGERVLWTAVGTIESDFPSMDIFIYTANVGKSDADIIESARVFLHFVLRLNYSTCYCSQNLVWSSMVAISS
jgi:hypothetical protein